MKVEILTVEVVILINLIESGTHSFASTLRTQLGMFEEADAMGLSVIFVVSASKFVKNP